MFHPFFKIHYLSTHPLFHPAQTQLARQLYTHIYTQFIDRVSLVVWEWAAVQWIGATGEINTQNAGPALRPTEWVLDPQPLSAQRAQASSARPLWQASSTFLVPCDLGHQITGWFGAQEQRLSSWKATARGPTFPYYTCIWPILFDHTSEGKQNDLNVGPTRGPWARIP